MIYITALTTLLLVNSSGVTTAKNYGPTTDEQCDAKTGIGCDAKDAPTNDNNTRRKRQELTPEKFHTTNKKKKSSDSNNDDDDDATLLPGECGLYLAPSALPHAGLGLFVGSTIPFDSSVNEYIGGTFPGYNDEEDTPLWTDLFIPIADKYKTLPYRGQQRFPSWLQYIWPESSGAMSDFTTKPFPVVPPQLWDFDQGLNSAIGLEFYMDDLNDMLFDLIPDYQPEQRVNAFVPGIASLANHAGVLSNVDRIYANSRADYNGQEAPWHAGAGAFTPHHGVEFIVTEEEGIKEGSELVSIRSLYTVLAAVCYFLVWDGGFIRNKVRGMKASIHCNNFIMIIVANGCDITSSNSIFFSPPNLSSLLTTEKNGILRMK